MATAALKRLRRRDRRCLAEVGSGAFAPASSPTKRRANTLLWSTERAVILLHEGTQRHLVFGQIGRLRLATSRATAVWNNAGWVVRVRRGFHPICRPWFRGIARRRSLQTILSSLFVGRRLPPPPDIQHGENFLSFAFFADPAQLAQVFERSVQRELVRCDFGKPVLGVHWSHRLAPETVLWLAPPLQGIWNRCLR